MRLSAIIPIFAFAAAATAASFAPAHNDDALPSAAPSVAESTTTLVTVPKSSTSLNIPITTAPSASTLPTSVNATLPSNSTRRSTTRTRKPHSEPVPIFPSKCNCPNIATVGYPCWATDSLMRCEFEELHSFICWTSAARGCPTPTRSCRSLFTPQPITGRHPCDIGAGNPPEPTATPTLTLTSARSSSSPSSASSMVAVAPATTAV